MSVTPEVDPCSLRRRVSPKQLREALGISEATQWRMVRRGELPPPIEFSAGLTGWWDDTIREWMGTRKAWVKHRRCA